MPKIYRSLLLLVGVTLAAAATLLIFLRQRPSPSPDASLKSPNQLASAPPTNAALTISPEEAARLERYDRDACRRILRYIERAKDNWELENNKRPTDTPHHTNIFGEYSYLKPSMVCPRGGQFVLGSLMQKPACTHPGHTL